jgi:thiol-disulfide isomerase/thioredoxin
VVIVKILIKLLYIFLATITSVNAEDSLLFFTADWCSHCIKAKEDIEANNIEAFNNLIYINYDQSKDFVKSYNIKKIPTFILLNDKGKEIDRKVGYSGIKNLIEFVRKK